MQKVVRLGRSLLVVRQEAQTRLTSYEDCALALGKAIQLGEGSD